MTGTLLSSLHRLMTQRRRFYCLSPFYITGSEVPRAQSFFGMLSHYMGGTVAGWVGLISWAKPLNDIWRPCDSFLTTWWFKTARSTFKDLQSPWYANSLPGAANLPCWTCRACFLPLRPSHSSTFEWRSTLGPSSSPVRACPLGRS